MVSSSSHRLLKGVSQVRNIEYRGAGMVWASSEVKFRKELGKLSQKQVKLCYQKSCLDMKDDGLHILWLSENSVLRCT